jgi:hypothetical protein
MMWRQVVVLVGLTFSVWLMVRQGQVTWRQIVIALVGFTFSALLVCQGFRVMWAGIKMIRTAWARAAPGRRTRVVMALLGGTLLGVVVWGSIIWVIVSRAPWR